MKHPYKKNNVSTLADYKASKNKQQKLTILCSLSSAQLPVPHNVIKIVYCESSIHNDDILSLPSDVELSDPNLTLSPPTTIYSVHKDPTPA